MVRVFMPQNPQTSANDNGVGQIIHAQYALLPAYGVEFVDRPEHAEVYASHIDLAGLPFVDVLFLHGLYFEDVPHEPYSTWHYSANQRIAQAARTAIHITVPSPWVAEPFKRDMRLSPHVIPHGIDLAHWQPVDQPLGYALWNKNRADDVCRIDPVIALAKATIPTVSTFGPADLPHLKVIGTQPFDQMRELVRHAGVYLATTPETFGIGTLEAMAAGVPILGYNWYGTADLVEHGVTGYLVDPNDSEGLVRGYHAIMRDRAGYAHRAQAAAQRYTWDAPMRRYAELLHDAAEQRKRRANGRVSVVVTSYNYARYLGGALQSLTNQTHRPEEVIVVDDDSPDRDQAIEVIGEHIDVAQRVVTILHDHNEGVAKSRNDGIEAATGDYIICLDADDEIGRDYIAACKNALDRDRELGIVYTGLGYLQSTGSVTPTQFPPPFDWEFQAEVANPPHTCVPTAAMFRRDLWRRAGGYIQAHAPGEDAEFYTRILSIGATARRVTDEALIHYRAHDGSASRTKRYKPINDWHPWMLDKHYPMGAPTSRRMPIRAYAQPAVSVIIPVGPRHLAYLPAALDSLLGQNMRQWEAVVVDDTNHDNNDWSRIEEVYPFIRRIACDARNPSSARNLGLAAARAPLSLFLDADDWLMPNALAALLHAHVATGRYAYGDAIGYNEHNERLPMRAPNYDQAGWWHEGSDGFPRMFHAVTALVPTEAARQIGFSEPLRGWEEQFFYADLAAAGVCGVRVPHPIIGYRLASGDRRRTSFEHEEELHAIRSERYAALIHGGEPMCCGGKGVDYKSQQAANEITWSGEEIPEGTELLEYTGPHMGLIDYRKARGRQLRTVYRFANAEGFRIQPVYTEDVDDLIAIGGFRRYSPSASNIVTSEPYEAEPTVATQPREDESTVVVDDQPQQEPEKPKVRSRKKASE